MPTDPGSLDHVEMRLRDDLGAAPSDLVDALRAVRAQSLPEPGAAHLARVLAAVHTAQDRAAAADLWPLSPPRAGAGASLLMAIRSQLPVVGLPLWLQPFVSPLLLTAPPLAALGAGYAFRAGDADMAELERACPVHPVELALARLLLVVGVDLALALIVMPWNTGAPLVSGGGHRPDP